jgi:hypothetical protein
MIGILVGLLILEVLSVLLVKSLRKRFQWLITSEDEYPHLSEEGLRQFFDHGYDPELGWIRKPNTKKEEIGKFGKTQYHIAPQGYRCNPGHEALPQKISFYGDSFMFARQVNDDETAQWYLSEETQTNVLNFSVGNYGLDQALLRLKREYPRYKTDIVIMGVVPSTIVRVLSVWKHYNEFGNTFGFKPRFVLEGDRLKLVKNFIDTEDKFLRYEEYLPEIRQYDYFYTTKFQREMIKFPYSISIIKNASRNIPLIGLVAWYTWVKQETKVQAFPAPMKIIMDVNLKLRYNLFTRNRDAVRLLEKLVAEFVQYAKDNDFSPVFVFMPQKDDMFMVKKKGGPYYQGFLDSISPILHTIDLTPHLIDRADLDELYSDDNQYGGHFSKTGNEFVAHVMGNALREWKLLPVDVVEDQEKCVPL